MSVMKKTTLLIVSAFAMLAFVATAEEGFVSIFNGKASFTDFELKVGG